MNLLTSITRNHGYTKSMEGTAKKQGLFQWTMKTSELPVHLIHKCILILE